MYSTELDKTGYRGTNQGTQIKLNGSSGFNAILAGWRGSNTGKFVRIDTCAYFWTSTFPGYSRGLTENSSQISRNCFFRANGFSVRCIKD